MLPPDSVRIGAALALRLDAVFGDQLARALRRCGASRIQPERDSGARSKPRNAMFSPTLSSPHAGVGQRLFGQAAHRVLMVLRRVAR